MWLIEDSVRYILSNNTNTKIAGFDLDHTLIKPKNNKKFPKDKDDWIFCYDINKILKLKSEYNIIIISNQSKFNDDLKYKLEKINEILDVSIFVSTNNDQYRKPLLGIWNIINKIYENIDIQHSFYCGDAAGRKNDFASSDYMFALNCGIKFYTPEHYFNNLYEKIELNNFNYDKYLSNNDIQLPNNNINKELILFVGFPGCGKSYLAKKINYHIINQDTLKTKKKCLKLSEKYMIDNKSIIIDNTNINIATRKDYIDLGLKYGYYIKCIELINPIKYCNHMNYYRVHKYNKKVIPIIAYRILKKKYEKPSLNEKFNEIINIENLLNINDIDLKYYYYYYNI